MTLSIVEAYAILVAERTHDPAMITKAIASVLAANRDASLLDAETTLRDAGSSVYLLSAGPGRFQVITGGLPAWRDALARAGLTPETNRQALALRKAAA